MWDVPRQGIKPTSPALAGGFLTTVPPGKSLFTLKWLILYDFNLNLKNFKKKIKKIFILLFIFGCVASSLLHAGFLYLRQAGATLPCGAQASHRGGFSCCGTQALGARASVVVARGLSICGARA